MLLAGKGGSVEHIVGPFYGPLKEVSPAGTSGLITNTVRPESRWSMDKCHSCTDCQDIAAVSLVCLEHIVQPQAVWAVSLRWDDVSTTAAATVMRISCSVLHTDCLLLCCHV